MTIHAARFGDPTSYEHLDPATVSITIVEPGTDLRLDRDNDTITTQRAVVLGDPSAGDTVIILEGSLGQLHEFARRLLSATDSANKINKEPLAVEPSIGRAYHYRHV